MELRIGTPEAEDMKGTATRQSMESGQEPGSPERVYKGEHSPQIVARSTSFIASFNKLFRIHIPFYSEARASNQNLPLKKPRY